MNTKPAKIPPFKVDEDKPFEGDALNRKEICKIWTRFIKNSPTPFVLAVDAEWGKGKTVFLQMWRAHFERICSDKTQTA